MSLNVEVTFDVQSKELTKDLNSLSKSFKQLGRQQGGVQQDTQAFGRQLRRLDNDVEEFTRDTRRATNQLDRFGDEARNTLGRLRGLDFKGVFDGALDGLKAAVTGDFRGAFEGLSSAAQAAARGIGSMLAGLLPLLALMRKQNKEAKKTNKLLREQAAAMDKVAQPSLLRRIAEMFAWSKLMGRQTKENNKQFKKSTIVMAKYDESLNDTLVTATAVTEVAKKFQLPKPRDGEDAFIDFRELAIALYLADVELSKFARDIAILPLLPLIAAAKLVHAAFFKIRDGIKATGRSIEKYTTGRFKKGWDFLPDSASRISKSLSGITSIAAPIVAVGAAATAAAAAVAVLAVAFAGLAAGIGTLAIGAAALKSWHSFTSEVSTLARAFGELDEQGKVTFESFKQAEKLTRIFRKVGLEISDTAEILAEFASKQKEVNAAAKKFPAAFKNVTWDNKDMMGNLEEVLVALSEIDSGTERSQLAFELFGEEGAKQLLPLISNSALLNETLAATPWVTEEDLEQVGRMNTAWNDIKTAIEGVMVKIGSELAPFIVPKLEAVASFVETRVAPALKKFFDDVVLGFQNGSTEGDSFGVAVGAAMKNIWTWVKKVYYEQIIPFFNYLKEKAKDPDIQYLIHTVLPMLAKVLGVTLYVNVALAILIFQGFVTVLDHLSGAIQRVVGWIKKLGAAIRKIPKLPGWLGGAIGGVIGGISLNATTVSMPTAYTPTVSPHTTPAAAPTNITIQGAIDPYATARQIESILGRQNARLRGKPTWA